MDFKELYTPRCIRTISGKLVNVFEPTVDMICIEDIAHALSHICRFGGHVEKFYSVAQHSVLTSQLVSKEHALAALLHDAAEAYMMDIPSPIKRELSSYNLIEDNLMRVIAEAFGFQYPLHEQIKEADRALLEDEWNNLVMKVEPVNFIVHQPIVAKATFLLTYHLLKSK